MRRKYFQFFIAVLTGFLFLTFTTSCEKSEDSNNDKPDDDNTTQENFWEPYKFSANTLYEYDYTFSEEGEMIYGGDVTIEVQDPQVTISGTMNGQQYESVVNNSDDIRDNFITAVSSTPASAVLYQSFFVSGFPDDGLETGQTWEYSVSGVNMYYEVTGKDSYAGYEGHVVEMEWTDGSEILLYTTCINSDMAMPLMTHIYDEDDQIEYHLELTNYQE